MSQPLPNPTPDAEPTLLEHISGQNEVVAALQVYLDSYWVDRQAGRNPSFGPVGLFGPPGVGKTLIAHALHAELGNVTFIDAIGETLTNRDVLYKMIMDADENTTLFIDEAQGLPKSAQHILLKVLAEGKLSVPNRYHRTWSIRLPRFVTILASTHEYTLQPALRSRLRIYARLTWYRIENLAEILQQRADARRWQVENPALFHAIARRAKKTPRLGLRLLETAYQVARSREAEVITVDHVDEAFRLANVDAEGLDALERSYLTHLNSTGTLRLNVLACRLGLPARTIQDVVEPYLIQEGFLTKDGVARVITEKGARHIEGGAEELS